MDTSFTWKCSTAAAPAPPLTQAERALKAAENTAPEVKAAMNPLELAAKKATTQMPSPGMRPMMQSATAPGWS